MDTFRRAAFSILLLAHVCWLSGCSSADDSSDRPARRGGRGGGGRRGGAMRGSPTSGPTARSSRDILSASVEAGQLRLTRGTVVVALLRPSKPLIEKWTFWNGTDQIVIRSSDKNGSVIMELFNVSDARRVASIAATAVQDGKPAWAAALKP